MAASASGTVKISVRPVNDAPLASAQSVATSEDTGLPITLLAADPDGDLIVYELVEAPVHGTLSGTVPTLIYQPATNYFGPDQIVFQVRDRTLQSSPATVAITVHPVNDAPFALARVAPLWGFSQETNRWIVSLNNSNALVRLDGSASFDVEEDPLNFAWFEGSDLVAAGQWATNTFEVGFHSIELQVTDGAATGSFLVDFEVITPATSIGMMMLWIDEAGLASRRAQPLLASLIAAASAFDRGSIPAGLSQLDAFRTKVSVQIAPEDPDLARRLDEAVRELLKAWGR